MKTILVFISALLLISCSPATRIANILRKHPELSKSDTVWKNDTTIRNLHTIDTSFITKPIDTVTIYKDKYKLQIIRKFDKLTVHDTVFADTTSKKIPVQVNSVSVKKETFIDRIKENVLGFMSVVVVILLLILLARKFFK